jgi:hypothetical protein
MDLFRRYISMTRRKFPKLLKPVAMMSAVLSAGAVLIMPAMAQTESQMETSQEIELSPEAFEILCERSPLNSRCEGGATEARGSEATDQMEQTDRIEERIDPSETDPAEAVSDPSQAPVDRESEGMSAPSTPSY